MLIVYIPLLRLQGLRNPQLNEMTEETGMGLADRQLIFERRLASSL